MVIKILFQEAKIEENSSAKRLPSTGGSAVAGENPICRSASTNTLIPRLDSYRAKFIL